MPLVAGNGLPTSSYQNNGGPRSGLFELVDAKFKHGFTDKKYTLIHILSSDNCTTLLPSKDKFRKYINKQILDENRHFNIAQSLLYITAGILYILPIITGFYTAAFTAFDTSITGETHHSLILHNFGIVFGDYVMPFLVTLGIAGILPLISIIRASRTANRKITDILNSYEAERNDTIDEHKLIGSFFILCEILDEINISRLDASGKTGQEIKKKIISIFTKYNIPITEITNNTYSSIELLDINIIDKKLRDFLLSDKFSKIIKLIVCKINLRITAIKIKDITANNHKTINAQFEKDLSKSIIVQNRILDIIAKIMVKEVDVREDPLPQPILITRDLDLLGVREALFEYWGDIEPDQLVIHYGINFSELSDQILIEYSNIYHHEFFESNVTSVKKPCIRQAPMLEYHPEPVYSSRAPFGCDYARP